jgi:hydrogenase/urease accessory protein HupE
MPARAWLAICVLLLVFTPARRALAHAVGLSNGDYRWQGQTLYADVSMSQRELAMLVPELDPDHDGMLEPEELTAATGALTRAVVGGIAVKADGTACSGVLDRALLLEGEAGVVVRARYACPTVPASLTLAWPIFAGLTPNHRQMARFSASGHSQNTVLDRGHASFTLALGAASASGSPPTSGIGWSMFKLGVEHILTGVDHLIFLFGLIVVGGSLRSLAGVVTAFTVAHSITLALAVFSVWAPSPRIVEPLIALSIAYVGIENFFVKDAARRWRITFPFGLIHGFGFAGALREIALPRAELPLSLLCFNLGVESGQLGILAALLPLTLWVRRTPSFGTRGVRWLNFAVTAFGVLLFAVRIAPAGTVAGR